MKLMLPLLIFCFLITGCKDKELSPKHLSNISVVRETEENRNIQKEYTTAQTENNSSPVSNRPQTNQHTRYHVIVASFGYAEKARAEKLTQQLKEKEYPATIIHSSQRYRVSIESFPSEAEANAARDEYREITDRQDIWVHKVE